jgi:hypothetical protein
MTGFDVLLLLHTMNLTNLASSQIMLPHLPFQEKDERRAAPGRLVVNNVFRLSFCFMRYGGHSCAQTLFGTHFSGPLPGLCVTDGPSSTYKGIHVSIIPCRQGGV